MRHKPPTGDRASETAFLIDSSAIAAQVAEASADLHLALAAASFADVLRASPDAASWDLATVRALALGAPSSPDRVGLLDMIDSAIALRSSGDAP